MNIMPVWYVILDNTKGSQLDYKDDTYFLHSYAYSQIFLYSCFVIYHTVDRWKCVFTLGDKPPTLLIRHNLSF